VCPQVFGALLTNGPNAHLIARIAGLTLTAARA